MTTSVNFLLSVNNFIIDNLRSMTQAKKVQLFHKHELGPYQTNKEEKC